MKTKDRIEVQEEPPRERVLRITTYYEDGSDFEENYRINVCEGRLRISEDDDCPTERIDVPVEAWPSIKKMVDKEIKAKAEGRE